MFVDAGETTGEFMCGDLHLLEFRVQNHQGTIVTDGGQHGGTGVETDPGETFMSCQRRWMREHLLSCLPVCRIGQAVHSAAVDLL